MAKDDFLVLVNDVLYMAHGHEVFFAQFVVRHALEQSVQNHLSVTAREYELTGKIRDLIS